MILLILVLSYIIGSVPFALIVGKWKYGIDIREHGSGNLGGTNTFRILGKKAGFIVTISDILKGTLAASLPLLLNTDLHVLLAGIPAVIGHCYPLFARFKGGKAVATSAGILLFYAPLMFLLLIAVFFMVLYLTKYVSLSSLVACMAAVLYGIVVHDILLITVMSAFLLFLLYRHRTNIGRIIAKTEPKIKWL
ncbi:glycerol-3-phosphate 1-O-acyltransferase PlsY [Fictibacillus sp. WQ 8-8]|uniref:glycerol-3-phosphate 1-O-acyltransferase PlsY n=1 Tax=unclassified Fictibacillus TaxID=2644029 RepID=UPI0021088C59|nr:MULTISPECIES: glycerol-3-phosphate 1-O-acyltransferase PlsY [unclassified Fictibacillus]MCQ6267223.1 glycerol-3-phosphate 1-O-acyltransferase PlsY [Fictibacillus sp. WQ 8-8]MED2973127.1 glycerol-3-phosphate 1-O-acyltransferase PlsY [Fictibacillus sp. B-59209]